MDQISESAAREGRGWVTGAGAVGCLCARLTVRQPAPLKPSQPAWALSPAAGGGRFSAQCQRSSSQRCAPSHRAGRWIILCRTGSATPHSVTVTLPSDQRAASRTRMILNEPPDCERSAEPLEDTAAIAVAIIELGSLTGQADRSATRWPPRLYPFVADRDWAPKTGPITHSLMVEQFCSIERLDSRTHRPATRLSNRQPCAHERAPDTAGAAICDRDSAFPTSCSSLSRWSL